MTSESLGASLWVPKAFAAAAAAATRNGEKPQLLNHMCHTHTLLTRPSRFRPRFIVARFRLRPSDGFEASGS